jgi:hypothetical protein
MDPLQSSFSTDLGSDLRTARIPRSRSLGRMWRVRRASSPEYTSSASTDICGGDAIQRPPPAHSP